MPYGSNDGYGRQQLRNRPSTVLTAVGRRQMSGASMDTLISQSGEAHRGPSPTRHTAPGHAPPDCASFDLSSEEGMRSTVEQHVRHHTPVQLPQGASRQALLSALEQANATIRQLSLELRAATRCGSAHDMGLQCEQLEAEQRELVRAFDDLSRVNGTLRKQLKQQTGETDQLREALLRAERDWRQQRAGATQTAQVDKAAEGDSVAYRLTRTLSRPLGKRLSKLTSPDRHRQLHSATSLLPTSPARPSSLLSTAASPAASLLPTAASPARTSCEHYVDEAALGA